MALCRLVCKGRKAGKRCTFAATVVRNPPTACPTCGAVLQPIWDSPSAGTGNRQARRRQEALIRKAAPRRSVDTPVRTADNLLSE